MTKIIKTLTSIFLFIGMISSLIIPITANESNGSISIILEDTLNESSKENVEFGITKVADIVQGEYVSLNNYSSFDLNKIENANDLKDTASKLKKYVFTYDYTGLTDSQGILKFNNLSTGVYLVNPIDIANYEIIEPTIVSVPTFDEMNGVMNYDIMILPKHSPLPIIEINKIDSKTDKLILNKQFEFTLYSDEDCTNVIETFTESNDGIIEFDITYGTYYLKETKAPSDYHLSKEVFKIEFNEDGMFFNDEIIESSNGRYEYDFENIKVSTQTPSTGDNANILLWQSLIALSVITLGVVAAIKDNKDEKNK